MPENADIEKQKVDAEVQRLNREQFSPSPPSVRQGHDYNEGNSESMHKPFCQVGPKFQTCLFIFDLIDI